jgi:DNA-binding CsgD family transcriptional regulator
MTELIDRRTRIWAGVAVVLGVLGLLAIEYREEPEMRLADLLLSLVDIVPLVLVSVGVVLLIRVTAQQREQTLTIVRDLEVARMQGERWRAEARPLLQGLGDAIDEQFKQWNLTEAEREVALLLLKGLSLKEIAQIRSTSERTIRAQARSLYGKAGLTGRAALSAFFLEDLMAPIGPVEHRDA